MASVVANIPRNGEAKWVFLATDLADILLGVGSVKNLVDLFLRFCWKPQDPAKLSPVSKAYYTQIHEKSLLGTILLIVPILGSLVGFLLLLSHRCNNSQDANTNGNAKRVNAEKGKESDDDIIRQGLRRLGYTEEGIEQYFREQRQRYEDGLRAQKEYQETERRFEETVQEMGTFREKAQAERVRREQEWQAQRAEFVERMNAIREKRKQAQLLRLEQETQAVIPK